MRPVPDLLVIVMTAVALSGCTDPAPVPESVEETDGIEVDPDTGQELFVKPRWAPGLWWDIHLAIDYGNGFLGDFDGRLIVSEQVAEGFRVGSTEQIMGIWDTYFDSFYVGRFDGNLNPYIQDTLVELYRWPLAENATWTTPFPAQGFDGFSGRVDDLTLNVTRFPEDEGKWGPRLRIQGATDHGESLDYDYAPSTGWMTYFRMLNTTTGRVIVSVDFKGAGEAAEGEIHHVTSEFLHGTFKMTPPFNPSYAPVPPVEGFSVAEGFDWVEEILFLFTYPVPDLNEQDVFGAGEVVVEIVRPDGDVNQTAHTGAGETYASRFERYVVPIDYTGDWKVSIAPAGTGGAFVGIFGFRDEMTTL